MVAGDPHQGGATWAVLQYVLGLRGLGHDVVLVEPVDELTDETRVYFDAVVRAFGLEDRAALVVGGTEETAGLGRAQLRSLAREADLLLNVSGMLDDEELIGPIARRAFLDLDPAFNQLWHEMDGIDMGFDRHDRFVTVGLCLGDNDCPVPTGGRAWVRTPQPVALEHWPADPGGGGDVTTIANFRGYGSVEHDGELYGQKAHSLRELVSLPERTPERLVLALAIHPDERRDLDALHRHGWHLADPGQVAGTPNAYARFIRASKAELGIAKSGYVRSRCGWFSDRSACYLATGRPVVAQDTGFGRYLPTGAGLLSFRDPEGAANALAEVAGDLPAHRRAARALAEDVFDARRVLPALLERLA
jgi:hypothetical protein